MIETPYLTRSRQAEPEPGGKRELFAPQSEQSKRSILDGIIQDFESPNPKDNLRSLSVLQNINILSTRGSLDKVSAPIPGSELELNLGQMLRDGIVIPSKSMTDMAERHGLEIPTKEPKGEVSGPTNTPDMLALKAPAPDIKLAQPGIREVTGALYQEQTKETMLMAKAKESLDTAFSSLLNPDEKKSLGLQKKEDGPTPTLPWEKSKKQAEDPQDPVALFNKAATDILALKQEQLKKLLEESFFFKALKLADKSTKGDKEKGDKDKSSPKEETDFLKNLTSKTHKMGPAGENIRMGIELVQAFTSKKDTMEKVGDITKTSAKLAVNLAKGAGTKMLASSLATPAAPLSAALIVLCAVTKLVTDPILSEMKQNTEAEGKNLPKIPGQGGGDEKNQQAGEAFNEVMNRVAPNAGGAKGLAKKGVITPPKDDPESTITIDPPGQKKKADEPGLTMA